MCKRAIYYTSYVCFLPRGKLVIVFPSWSIIWSTIFPLLIFFAWEIWVYIQPCKWLGKLYIFSTEHFQDEKYVWNFLLFVCWWELNSMYWNEKTGWLLRLIIKKVLLRHYISFRWRVWLGIVWQGNVVS